MMLSNILVELQTQIKLVKCTAGGQGAAEEEAQDTVFQDLDQDRTIYYRQLLMPMDIKTNRAFTLIELLVVVAIIGILAAGGVTTFGGFQEKAKVDAVKYNNKSSCKKIINEKYFFTLLVHYFIFMQ